MIISVIRWLTFLMVLAVFAGGPRCWGQSSDRPPDEPQPDAAHGAASAAPGSFLRNVAFDQTQIWTGPFRARVRDLNWLAPIAGLTVGMINADAEMSSRVNASGTLSRHSSTISNAGLALTAAEAGGFYVLGRLNHDARQRETGILSVEAAANSMVVVEAFKVATRRERPTDGTGLGRFGHSSSPLNSSFPSAHAMVAWSVASVVAHEYPGRLSEVLTYGLAAGISATRISGKQHFPSDVFAGAAMGWLIGHQAYTAHHDRDLSSGDWGTFHRDEAESGMSPGRRFSPYVPLDSWVYAAIDRLQGLGVTYSTIQGMRPWTRAECARLLHEAGDITTWDPGSEASRLYAALEREFTPELQETQGNYIGIDSVYARVTGISGTPLTDGFHFGQTIVNDFGRPYQSGGNGLAGFSSSASAGPLGFYVRGEYEHAPSAPGFSQAVQNAIAFADQKPSSVPAFAIPAFDRFRLLDSYIALNLNGWQTSFGKQSLSLGPTRDPFLESSNPEPIYMLRVDQTSPRDLPGFLRVFGAYRMEFWAGKLTGHHFVNTQDGNFAISLGRTLSHQPMVNGAKIQFKVTPNFEFGVGRTGLWGGPDFPITLGSTRRSFFSSSNGVGRGTDPGDRRSTVEFTYRIPGMRNRLTLYDDSFVEDEISPIGYPRRAAHSPGIYLSRIPGLPHADLRLEASYTNLPGLIQASSGGFFYWNVRYLDGYTNQGNIIGNATVGRQGVALRGESTWWVASDKTIRLGFRSNTADSGFAGGGNLRDGYLNSEWRLNQHLSLTSFLQYERWNFPVLSAGHARNNFTASFQLTYWPKWKAKALGQ